MGLGEGEGETPTSDIVVVEVSARKLNFNLLSKNLEFSFRTETKL